MVLPKCTTLYGSKHWTLQYFVTFVYLLVLFLKGTKMVLTRLLSFSKHQNIPHDKKCLSSYPFNLKCFLQFERIFFDIIHLYKRCEEVGSTLCNTFIRASYQWQPLLEKSLHASNFSIFVRLVGSYLFFHP